MLKILSPLTRKEEVGPLTDAGADEFYCGLVSPKGSLNDRPNDDQNSFCDAVQLGKATAMVHQSGKKIYLAINKPTLDLEAAIDQARIAEQIGVDGLILSNLLLIKKLKDMNLKLELNGSCLCAVFNSQSIEFFRKLGIETFHLPRHMGIEHFKMIAQKYPHLRLSVFGMRGMCMNVEAFCLLHYLEKEYSIPCRKFRTVRVWGTRPVAKNILDRKINMPKFGCGLCSFKQFNDMGIYSIKIEGRHAGLQSKLRYVSLIKSVLNNIDTCKNDDAYRGLCRKLFKEHFHETCKTEYCYY